MQLIETKTLGTAGASIEFTDIPQNFTDLYVLYSIRATADTDTFNLKLNVSTANFTQRYLRAEVGSVNSASRSDNSFVTSIVKSVFTANTFSNSSLYIPNYTSSSNKSISEDTVSENNATDGRLKINAALWSNSAAITSMTFEAFTGNLAAGSTVSLYGIGGAGDGYAPKATGGSINFANGYWYHTFTSSGTFAPTEEIAEAEVLVVSGGGGGGASTSFGYYMAGGGGAGGVKKFTVSMAADNYAVTVGAGGGSGSTGVASSLASLASTSGGGYGAFANNANPLQVGGNGGSGGGGAGTQFSSVGGTGVSGEGFGGGSGAGSGSSSGRFGGGGGGAGGAGGTTGGGVGSTSFNDWASATSTGELVSGTRYFGGGGGGGAESDPGANGGHGGGGDGGDRFSGSNSGTPGIANTGGGGGGGVAGSSNVNGSAGGSGIVIVRYAA